MVKGAHLEERDITIYIRPLLETFALGARYHLSFAVRVEERRCQRLAARHILRVKHIEIALHY